MSAFEVPIVRVTSVADHPNADRLSLVNFQGFTTISAKLEDGSHRYAEGDLVVYVPEGAIVPAKERSHFRFGRVALKLVSPDYLTRKGSNVTEFA